MATLTVAGPNLRDPVYTFHVHAAGCADLKGKTYQGIDPPWTADFDSLAEVVRDVYADIMRENDEDPADLLVLARYGSEFRFFPCVDHLTQPNPSAKLAGTAANQADPERDGQKEGIMPKSQSTNTCLCGCGAPVKRRFLPGHDARLKGQLQRAYRSGTNAEKAKAERLALELGWMQYLTDSPSSPKPVAKVNGTKVSAPVPAPAGFNPVRVKVGRWTYDAVILSEDVNEVTVRYTGAGGKNPTVKTVKRSALQPA